VCSRPVSSPEVTDPPQLAIVKPTVPTSLTGDDNVKPLEAASRANSLTRSAKQDMSHVADISNDVADVSNDHMPIDDDGELVEYEEEVQER